MRRPNYSLLTNWRLAVTAAARLIHTDSKGWKAVKEFQDLLNVDEQKSKLVTNTEQFLAGLPANNALLWGARGTGKSTLIHALLNAYHPEGLRLVEVKKEDLARLSEIVERLAKYPFKFITNGLFGFIAHEAVAHFDHLTLRTDKSNLDKCSNIKA